MIMKKAFANKTTKFTLVIEKDEDGFYMATVPELPGCHTQARSLDKLEERIREAVTLYLSVEKEIPRTTFFGVQVLEVKT